MHSFVLDRPGIAVLLVFCRRDRVKKARSSKLEGRRKKSWKLEAGSWKEEEKKSWKLEAGSWKEEEKKAGSSKLEAGRKKKKSWKLEAEKKLEVGR
ncbi:MAG: hypothetical protein R6U62_08075 [Bacteroidales bacterium]